MARVYLDTSFVSSLVTTRTDVASVYRRNISTDWHRTQAPNHDLFISPEVVTELESPSYPARDAAFELIAELPLLEISDRVVGMATLFANERLMPGPEATGDALHVAVAVVHQMDYLLSWNVRHLANPNKTRHLQVICQRLGLLPPVIITPEALWERSS